MRTAEQFFKGWPIILFGLMLAGCAPTLYVHPSKNAADFEKDRYDCQLEAEQSAYNLGATGNVFLIRDRIQQCLQAKHGWRPELKKSEDLKENVASTRGFRRPTRNGNRIDQCVQGEGWDLLDPQRCDNTRQSQIAKKYCLESGYSDQFLFVLEKDLGNHAILTFSKGGSYQNGMWTQVSGIDAFEEIACVR